MIDILQIPIAALDDYWPHVWPQLEKGVQVSGRTREELAADILTDLARVWIATSDNPRRVRAAWLTELVRIDGKRVLNVYGLGGERPTEWVRVLAAEMERHAKAENCAAIRYLGRQGWSRLLPEYQQIDVFDGNAVYQRALA